LPQSLATDQLRELPWAAGSGFTKGMQDGHFFCCRIGQRTYLSFFPSDGSDIVTDTLQYLRRISCDENTPREIPDALWCSSWEIKTTGDTAKMALSCLKEWWSCGDSNPVPPACKTRANLYLRVNQCMPLKLIVTELYPHVNDCKPALV